MVYSRQTLKNIIKNAISFQDISRLKSIFADEIYGKNAIPSTIEKFFIKSLTNVIYEFLFVGHFNINEPMLDSYYFNMSMYQAKNINALHFSCILGSVKVLKFLLSCENIDVNFLTESLNTGLILACKAEQKKVVEFLLSDARVDPNIQGERGFTSLHFVTAAGDYELVSKFLNHKNLNINLKNDQNTTPFEVANILGMSKIIKIFLENTKFAMSAEMKRFYLQKKKSDLDIIHSILEYESLV